MENLYSDLSDATILSWIMSMIQVLNNFGVMTQTVKQRSGHVSNSMISFIGMYGQFFRVEVSRGSHYGVSRRPYTADNLYGMSYFVLCVMYLFI